MKVCPACTKENEDAAAFCGNCGAQFSPAAFVTPQAPAPQPALQQSPAPQHGPQETSGLAIASLICGFLFFIFPAAVLAVVFGHISSSQIRKSAGRLKGAGMSLAGMILGYVGIALHPNNSDHRRDRHPESFARQNGRQRSQRHLQPARHLPRRHPISGHLSRISLRPLRPRPAARTDTAPMPTAPI